MPSNDAVLLFLLLLAAAAAGWWFGRNGRSVSKKNSATPLSKDYIRGLNFLVNNQADKAIEVFVRLMEVDSETVETHLALGGLFRRRGEVDRALRIHQNLIARPNLERAHRHTAMFELAKDYLKAGVLDRAESLFLELVEHKEHQRESVRNLLTIYEREHDWQQAITLCARAGRQANVLVRQVVPHYHCELAEQALRRGDEHAYQASLKRAIAADERVPRVWWMRGTRAYQSGNFNDAVRYLRRALEQRTALAPIAVAPLMDCYQRSGQQAELRRLLEHLRQNHEGVAPALALAELAFDDGNLEQAQTYLLDYIQRSPDTQGLGRILYSVLNVEPSLDQHQILTRIRNALKAVLDRAPAYQCKQCGYEVQQLEWRCPSCEQWDSLQPHAHYISGSLTIESD